MYAIRSYYVVGIALDEADFAIAQRDADAATASAHVTGRVLDLDAACLVERFRQGVMYRLRHKDKPVIPARPGVRVTLPIDCTFLSVRTRITSYNVCYTKLLRLELRYLSQRQPFLEPQA